MWTGLFHKFGVPLQDWVIKHGHTAGSQPWVLPGQAVGIPLEDLAFLSESHRGS